MLQELNSILLYVQDISASKEFYEKLGFEISEYDDAGFNALLGNFAIQCYDQEQVEFKKDFEGVEKGAGVFFSILVENIDDYYKQLIENGITPSSEPRDWEWGNREFVAKDPDGYRYVFYTPIEQN